MDVGDTHGTARMTEESPMAPSPLPDDQKGPFTHTWTGSVSVGGYERAGRWPGIVALWDRFLETHGDRLRPRWEWFLYGRRVWVGTTLPSATLTKSATGVAHDGTVTMGMEFTAGDALGRFFKGAVTGFDGDWANEGTE